MGIKWFGPEERPVENDVYETIVDWFPYPVERGFSLFWNGEWKYQKDSVKSCLESIYKSSWELDKLSMNGIEIRWRPVIEEGK